MIGRRMKRGMCLWSKSIHECSGTDLVRWLLASSRYGSRDMKRQHGPHKVWGIERLSKMIPGSQPEHGSCAEQMKASPTPWTSIHLL